MGCVGGYFLSIFIEYKKVLNNVIVNVCMARYFSCNKH